jgi:hypothetical protein
MNELLSLFWIHYVLDGMDPVLATRRVNAMATMARDVASGRLESPVPPSFIPGLRAALEGES